MRGNRGRRLSARPKPSRPRKPQQQDLGAVAAAAVVRRRIPRKPPLALPPSPQGEEALAALASALALQHDFDRLTPAQKQALRAVGEVLGVPARRQHELLMAALAATPPVEGLGGGHAHAQRDNEDEDESDHSSLQPDPQPAPVHANDHAHVAEAAVASVWQTSGRVAGLPPLAAMPSVALWRREIPAVRLHEVHTIQQLRTLEEVMLREKARIERDLAEMEASAGRDDSDDEFYYPKPK